VERILASQRKFFKKNSSKTAFHQKEANFGKDDKRRHQDTRSEQDTLFSHPMRVIEGPDALRHVSFELARDLCPVHEIRHAKYRRSPERERGEHVQRRTRGGRYSVLTPKQRRAKGKDQRKERKIPGRF